MAMDAVGERGVDEEGGLRHEHPWTIAMICRVATRLSRTSPGPDRPATYEHDLAVGLIGRRAGDADVLGDLGLLMFFR
ncbi:hypothetical protein ACWDV4_03345 [Micromonospora sp. NPDC003197]